jgi:hypothetical protein
MKLISMVNLLTAGETTGDLEIRPIQSLEELREVYRLTHDCYVEKNYIEPRASQILVHYPEFDHLAETHILVAIQGNEVVGSVSFTVDGPNGFVIDKDYAKSCDAIRHEGHRVANVWRLVIKKSCRSSNQVLMGLLTRALTTLMNLGTRTCLIDVNREHEAAYRRFLNMTPVERRAGAIGEEKHDTSSVLLRCDADRLPKKWLSRSSPDASVASFQPSTQAA